MAISLKTYSANTKNVDQAAIQNAAASLKMSDREARWKMITEENTGVATKVFYGAYHLSLGYFIDWAAGNFEGCVLKSKAEDLVRTLKGAAPAVTTNGAGVAGCNMNGQFVPVMFNHRDLIKGQNEQTRIDAALDAFYDAYAARFTGVLKVEDIYAVQTMIKTVTTDQAIINRVNTVLADRIFKNEVNKVCGFALADINPAAIKEATKNLEVVLNTLPADKVKDAVKAQLLEDNNGDLKTFKEEVQKVEELYSQAPTIGFNGQPVHTVEQDALKADLQSKLETKSEERKERLEALRGTQFDANGNGINGEIHKAYLELVKAQRAEASKLGAYQRAERAALQNKKAVDQTHVDALYAAKEATKAAKTAHDELVKELQKLATFDNTGAINGGKQQKAAQQLQNLNNTADTKATDVANFYRFLRT